MRRRARLAARAAVLAGGLLVVVLCGGLIFGEMGLLQYLRMRDRLRQLEQELEAVEQANVELRTELWRAQNDPVRIEELARERLGFVRPGEIVYQLVKEGDQGACCEHPR
jgi:cell division protein FtsB